jgi:hypothetical protein
MMAGRHAPRACRPAAIASLNCVERRWALCMVFLQNIGTLRPESLVMLGSP